MIALKNCPNCGSLRIEPYKILLGKKTPFEVMPGVKVDTATITRYSICRECGLIFLTPRLSDRELETFYNSGYYRKVVHKPSEGMDKAEEDRAKLDSKVIKKHIGKVYSHLDIGCGLGYLLEAVDADLKVGVEADVNYVKFKSVKVFGLLKNVSPKKFELVTLIHSLEHIARPLEYLKEIVKFVKKGGFLVIEVPSLKTRGGPLAFTHLSYFQTDVLKLMCLKVGLKPVHVEFTPHLLLICQTSKN